MFKYNVGDEPSPGFVIVERVISPITGNAFYFVNDFGTPFSEEEVENMSFV